MVFDERPMKRQPHYITNFCSRLRRPGLLITGTHSYEDYLVLGRGVLEPTTRHIRVICVVYPASKGMDHG